MSGAPTPQVLLEAIASDAGPTFITAPMPETPPGTPSNAASIQGGYPPKVMQSELAGGLPPLGQDMNGFLFLLSSHTLYVECGQLYPYNADLATAIAGYLVGTVLGMTDGTGMWLNIVNGNTTDPDAGGAGWVPIAAYGKTTVPVTGGTVTLTAAQAKYGVIILTGALVSNLTINLPQNIQEWLIINGTSGAFQTTIKTAAGGSTGVTASQGGFTSPLGVYSVGDGNIYPTVAPLSIPIDQNPTPLTIVERTNGGYVLATYFNANSPVDNISIANVITDQGDGYFRKNSLSNFEAQVLLQGIGGQLVNGQVPFSVIAQWAATLFSSPAFTGVPTTPTAPAGTANAQVASTAFANPGVVVNGNGVCINLPSGYKIQMGICNPNGGTVTVTFPVPFTSAVYPVGTGLAGGAVQTWFPNTSPPGLANMRVSNTGGQSYWIAIGI